MISARIAIAPMLDLLLLIRDRGTTLAGAAWTLIAIAAAIGPLLMVGMPGRFASSGQDIGPAMLWLHDMTEAMGQGVWWPRWMPDGNRGFGSPAFFFYPPFAYWTASGVRAVLGLETAEALVVAAMLWRLAATMLGYAWLRRQASRRAALTATALLALQTYNLLVNPLVRFAYAEMAGTAVMLLGLYAASGTRPLRWIPPAFALLVLTHLPTAVLAGGVLPAWNFVAYGSRRAAFRQAGCALLGCLLGAGIAAAYLLPALVMLPEVNTEGWDTGGLTTWPGHFLLERVAPPKAPMQFWLMNGGLLVLLGSAAALAWNGHRPHFGQLGRRCASIAILFALLCVLMTPLSWPVWAKLPMLQRVQFPWRIMPFATAIWAVMTAVRLDQLAAAGLRRGQLIAMLTAFLFALPVLWIPYSAVTAALPALGRYNWTRLVILPPGPRPLPAENPPEYTPRAAMLAGWNAELPATDSLLMGRLLESRAAAPGVRVEKAAQGAMRVSGTLTEPAAIVLPQFAFPGWDLANAPAGARVETDSGSGLLRLDLPAGPLDLVVHRAATIVEQIGWSISGTALVVWVLLAPLAWPTRRRAVSHPSSIQEPT